MKVSKALHTSHLKRDQSGFLCIRKTYVLCWILFRVTCDVQHDNVVLAGNNHSGTHSGISRARHIGTYNKYNNNIARHARIGSSDSVYK